MRRITAVLMIGAAALLLSGCQGGKLFDVVNAGDVAEVERLLDRGVYPDLRDSDGRTPLHVAAERGDVRIARALLDHGASLDPREQEGQTPLHLAAEQGHAGVAQLLVRRGADIGTRDERGRTPLQVASAANQRQLIALLSPPPPARSTPAPTAPRRVVSRPAPQRTSGG